MTYRNPMKTDLTFFTNEPGQTLLDRFRKTLKDVRYFDILVDFFRTMRSIFDNGK